MMCRTVQMEISSPEKKIKVKFHSLDLIMSCRLYCRLNQMVGWIPGTLPHINECWTVIFDFGK